MKAPTAEWIVRIENADGVKLQTHVIEAGNQSAAAHDAAKRCPEYKGTGATIVVYSESAALTGTTDGAPFQFDDALEHGRV